MEAIKDNFGAIFLILNLLMSWNLCYSQKVTDTITLKQYELIDSSLIDEINSFIDSERVCSYYSDSLCFSIDVCDWNGDLEDPCTDSDTLVVTISSQVWDDLLYLRAVGFFIYNGRFITISNVASDKFFSHIGSQKTFIYKEFGNYYRHDRSTYWTYKYYDRIFYLEHEKYNCPTSRIEK